MTQASLNLLTFLGKALCKVANMRNVLLSPSINKRVIRNLAITYLYGMNGIVCVCKFKPNHCLTSVSKLIAPLQFIVVLDRFSMEMDNGLSVLAQGTFFLARGEGRPFRSAGRLVKEIYPPTRPGRAAAQPQRPSQRPSQRRLALPPRGLFLGETMSGTIYEATSCSGK